MTIQSACNLDVWPLFNNMWQFLLRGWVLRSFRYVMLPISITIGVLGTQVEGIFQKDKIKRDNTDFPSAFDRRSLRQLQEMEDDGAANTATKES